MTRSSSLPIGTQLAALVEKVAENQNKGNLDALFAWFIWQPDDRPRLDLSAILPDSSWFQEHADRMRRGDFNTLAAAGYALQNSSEDEANADIEKGLLRLQQRDPFPQDGVSFLNSYKVLFGLSLLANTQSTGNIAAFRAWLKDVISTRMTQTSLTDIQVISLKTCLALLGEKSQVIDLSAIPGLPAQCLAEWSCRQGLLLAGALQDLTKLRSQILYEALQVDPQVITGADEASLMWSAVSATLLRTTQESLFDRSSVAWLLKNFEPAMRRWRWDSDEIQDPIRWPMKYEREVQDVLWLILRSYFSDVVDEESLPKWSTRTYRPDFGIPSLGLLIEAKYVTSKNDFGRALREIMEDSIAYVRSTASYDRLIVFIYDDSASVQIHDDVMRELRTMDEIEDVVIVSRPSQLPAGTPSRKK